MTETRIIQKAALGELFLRLYAEGQRVVAPQRDGEQYRFREVKTPDAVALDYVATAESAKTTVFPRYEEMLRYALSGKDVVAEELEPVAPPTVLFGVHPCDAASFATLKAVFTWDSADAYFEPKLANLTIIGLSCTQGDRYCFCTSVGGGPGETRGSDILLTPLDATRFLAEIITDKGQALVKLAAELFKPANGEAQQKTKTLANIPPRFKATDLSARLPALFPKSEIWVEQSLRCLGCGCCAYVCPTCSCFDIQDERQRDGGVRVRCWDACGFALFTQHASGHNPRSKQSERWRQRVMHKFSYQPERLGVLGCVGCGRCSRSCPADMNLAEHVAKLAKA